MANTEVKVVDRDGREVGVDEKGEVCQLLLIPT